MRDSPGQPYSNELANGDVSDDKQLQDVDNAKYDVADDVGFTNVWKHNGNVAQQRRVRFNQMRDSPGQPYSNELANGDVSDDKQLQDVDNAKYDIADDVGFTNVWKHNGNVAQQKRIRFNQMRRREIPSNEVANGDVSEDKELEDIDDPNDYVVDDNGFVNAVKRTGAVS
jgi:hypothetical protein